MGYGNNVDIAEATTTLNLSEHFYSVQCEGASTGYPAYFIRLKGCNLMCGGKDGSLMKEGSYNSNGQEILKWLYYDIDGMLKNEKEFINKN